MILAYHRPATIDEALKLISRPEPHTLPLGGGTRLSRPESAPIEVVDIQALGLNRIHKKGKTLEIGAAVTLQDLLENKLTPPALKTTLKLEAPLNIRNAATIAGTMVACDGRSPLATIMLALDAKITILAAQPSTSNLGDFLPLRPNNLRCILLTQFSIPLNTKLAFQFVARTPADKPIVCAGLVQWPSERTRLALGGYGKAPLLAMDGTDEGLESAARNAYHEASDDWASAEYRMDMAAELAIRCREQILQISGE